MKKYVQIYVFTRSSYWSLKQEFDGVDVHLMESTSSKSNFFILWYVNASTDVCIILMWIMHRHTCSIIFVIYWQKIIDYGKEIIPLVLCARHQIIVKENSWISIKLLWRKNPNENSSEGQIWNLYYLWEWFAVSGQIRHDYVEQLAMLAETSRKESLRNSCESRMSQTKHDETGKSSVEVKISIGCNK